MQEHFGKSMNMARIKLMALLIHALCVVQKVSLHKLAAAMPADAKRNFNMRRIQRFLAKYSLDLDLIARMIFSLLPNRRGLVLSMNRTNWKFGGFNINILMLGVTNKSVAFPLIFKLMPKRGNSRWTERKELVKRFGKLFGYGCIDCLVADREFVGKDWTGWLNSMRIRYYIRIRQNFWVQNPRSAEKTRAWNLFNRVRLGEELFYHKPYLMNGEYVYLTGARLKNSKGVPELQILICYNHPHQAIGAYRERWQIETLFRAMQSSGFNIEDTHLRDIERIKRLVAMVCMALVWAYLVGEHEDMHIKKIRVLKHGHRSKSIVKYGLEEIADVLNRPWQQPDFDIFNFLSCN